MKFICSLIVVEDIEKSKMFYRDILGQKIKFDFVENVTFEGDFAIHKKSHYKSLIENRNVIHGENNVELYFEYDDVDEIEDILVRKGIEFVHKTREQPWRQKVLRIYDPDKYIIEIGESLAYLSYRLSNEGMKEEEIVKTVGISLEMVKNGIREIKNKNK
jgi:catechol 2,3-dioxygenase-like lactoylglutathione lyase family enzyme